MVGSELPNILHTLLFRSRVLLILQGLRWLNPTSTEVKCKKKIVEQVV